LILDSEKKIFEKIRIFEKHRENLENLEKRREEEFNSDREMNNLKTEFDALEKDSIIERKEERNE
jgi:hypothetical protein